MPSSPSPLLQKYLIADLPSAEDIRPWLERMDESRWYTNFGPLVGEFENKLSTMLSAADPYRQNGPIHVTTMASCYHALEAGLRLLGVKPGDKVLMPAVSFPACPLAVQHVGAEPVFADLDPTSWLLTPETARQVAQKTKLAAVMPLALYGVPLPAPAWDAFTSDTGVPVIIDAAAAIESQAILHKGLVAHSLHATKPFGIGEGGVLVSRDPELIRKARVYSNFGTIERIALEDGLNAKMSEYHAAVGLAQAARWVMAKKKRQSVLALYRKHLKPLANAVSLQPGIEEAVVSLFMLRFGQPVAADLVMRGREEGMAFHHTYLPPLYHHPYFSGITVANDEGRLVAGDAAAEKKAAHMRHSEMIMRHVAGIPFHPFLGEEEVATAVTAIRRVAGI